MSSWNLAILKALSAFIIIFVFTKIPGRKLLSEMTVFDLSMTLVVGAVVGNFITIPNGSIDVLIGLGTFAATAWFAGYLAINSIQARKLIEGEPVIVIQNGRILDRNMAKVRYTLSDLEMQLREKDVFNIDEVEFALLEANGQLSVLKKSQYSPATPHDLHIATQYKGLATELIKDGQVFYENLDRLNLSETWLLGELAKKNIADTNNVFYATLNTDGTLFVDLKRTAPPHLQKIED